MQLTVVVVGGGDRREETARITQLVLPHGGDVHVPRRCGFQGRNIRCTSIRQGHCVLQDYRAISRRSHLQRRPAALARIHRHRYVLDGEYHPMTFKLQLQVQWVTNRWNTIEIIALFSAVLIAPITRIDFSLLRPEYTFVFVISDSPCIIRPLLRLLYLRKLMICAIRTYSTTESQLRNLEGLSI